MNGDVRNGNNYPDTRYISVFDQENRDVGGRRLKRRRKGWFGTRHFVTFMLYLGMANAYIMRTNMSVAIVAMFNHTAIEASQNSTTVSVDEECGVSTDSSADGQFVWETDTQGYVLSSFFYGYVITQIPFGILSKRYGNIYFLGVGMLINSVFGLLVPVAANMGIWWPDSSQVYTRSWRGAQFGTVISMPLSGLLSGKWLRLAFYFLCVLEPLDPFDPEANSRMNSEERLYIQKELGAKIGAPSTPIPLIIKDNGILSALPYLAMWLFSIFISHVADWMLTKPYFNHTIVRKLINGIGQYGPAAALVWVSFTGCDKWVTVILLTIGVGLNGGIYSGFKVNHLDISPQFAGILMSFTNCLANLAGLLAPIYAGNVVVGTPSIAKWRTVFVTAACVYAGCCTFYIIFGSGVRQSWDQPASDPEPEKKKGVE
ncbi:hypothetical protein NQ317_009571 [Molorchus minor]|uniref:Inorganic phosphate cotransporter n=1 Tax=Molorchus minor TaxID=1323400 RepID=A0ABQ9IZ50_9CUCU|nr:hypothetical protein NQ317_009571 [Molorchus minor]